MNDYKNFCEYSTRPEITGKTVLIKALLLILYTLFCLVYLWIFGLNFRAWALIIMLPFIMYAIIKITWRRTDVQYEFLIEAGELSIAKIYGNSSRRVKAKAYIPEMTLIAPYAGEGERALSARDIVSVKNYAASKNSEGAWVCVYPDRDKGKKHALIIETNEEMRRILHLCNPSATVRPR